MVTDLALWHLRDSQFVSLTTFRRDGTPVPTTVWIAVADGAPVVWTPGDTFKVKRLRRDDRVRLQRCSRRGRLDSHAPILTGTAVIESDPAVVASTERAVRNRYGIQFVLITAIERVLFRKRAARVSIRITLDE